MTLTSGIQEGYLLYLDLQDESIGVIWYAVLEEGMLKFYESSERQDIQFIHQIELSGNDVDVEISPSTEISCIPCCFLVSLHPYDVNTCKQERRILLCAASMSKVKEWCRSLMNWKRHSFDTSFRSLPLSDEAIHEINENRQHDLKILKERQDQYELVSRTMVNQTTNLKYDCSIS